MPGNFTSTAHFVVASTFPGISSRCIGLPAIFSSGIVFVFALPLTEAALAPLSVTLNFCPPISSPYVTCFDASAFTVITPSLTASPSTGMPKRAEAISSNTRRASAATRRIGSESRSIAVEPPEPT